MQQDNLSMLQRLHQLAEQMMSRWSFATNHYTPQGLTFVNPELYRLAAEFSGNSEIRYADVLPLLCEREACTILLSLPNHYWFWDVLFSATTHLQGSEDKLTSDRVSKGMAISRHELSQKYDLTLPLKDLTAAQLASRTAAGVILVKHKSGDHDEIYFNPIFAPCPGTENPFPEWAAALRAAVLQSASKT